MKLKITTWNINSVRLRINLVAKFIKAAHPDVICLQETKCPDSKFPLKRFARLGYPMRPSTVKRDIMASRSCRGCLSIQSTPATTAASRTAVTLR